jgi:phospholipid/cholesterol/gamma-HCH transport system substrate-binding protein
MFRSGLTRILGIVAAVAVLVALVLLVIPSGGTKHVVAEFPRTVSLYQGSEVKILGVAVGKVDSVTPAGTKVLVKISYDSKYKVPKDAKAALISPSIVGDRFIQLTPAYKGGAVMADNTHLGLDRTATPLELDQIYSGINDLTTALGPDGANKADSKGVGALTRLLDSTARNFGGEGVKFNQTLQNLGKLTKTLDDNKDDLFGTARQLEVFVNDLAKNDTTVRAFNDSLASGADMLAGERKDLAAALRNLGTALVEVKGFVKDNRDLLGKNITGVNRVAKILVKRRGALDEILKTAPDALNNLGLAYNPDTGTLDTRDNAGEVSTQLTNDPAAVICGFLSVTKDSGKNCDSVVGALKVPRAAALKRSSKVDDPGQYVDRSLGGLVEVKR